MDPPPNIWEFDRYSRSSQGLRKQVEDLLPKRSFEIETGPILSCPGLALRQHPLISTPTMGIRPTTSPTIPLPEWQDPLSKVEFSHLRPFESHFFGKEKPLYLIGGERPDRKGHFMEVSNVYSRDHARQDLDHLKENPFRGTEWSKKNVRGRTKSYHTMRLDRVTELDSQSKLYSGTSSRFGAEDKAKEQDLHENIRQIITARRRYNRKACGLHVNSKMRHKQNQERSEALRLAREKEVRDHISQHDDRVLAYRIVFDKFDEDGSGHMDSLELRAALYHMGLDVPESEARVMLEKYDANKDGGLDFDEFSALAKLAQLNSESKSLFLKKEVLARNTK